MTLKLWFAMMAGVMSLTRVVPADDGLLQLTYESYARAVQDRDLDGLFDTITTNPTFHYLNSRGQLTTTRQEYYQNHREWFKEKNWQISFDPPLIYRQGDLGYVIAVFHYQGPATDGKVNRLDSFCTLIFSKEQEGWKAIADICTPIR